MSGEVVHYKFCSVPFGQYCQVYKEGTPRNSLLARTQGAIALGPSGNVQGGHEFYTLNSGSGVLRQDWKCLPMPPSVIDRIHSKAIRQPAQPVFTDQLGNPIGDVALAFDNEDTMETQPTAQELPGVMLP
jgi:hypothetical protein